MLFSYRGLFSESEGIAPQWVVALIIGMLGPYCSLRFASRAAGFISQNANRSFNFTSRDEEPDLEPNAIWPSVEENEFYGSFSLVYPVAFGDLPRIVPSVWIRASWRPSHASVVWPMLGGRCHIAMRPPRGTSSCQYDFGTGRTCFKPLLCRGCLSLFKMQVLTRRLSRLNSADHIGRIPRRKTTHYPVLSKMSLPKFQRASKRIALKIPHRE